MARMVQSWGLKIVGVWLVLDAANHLFGFSFTNFHLLMAVFALIAGVLLIVGK